MTGERMPPLCPWHEPRGMRLVFSYDAQPEGEIPYPLEGRPYHRTVWCCDSCGHYLTDHELDLSRLYEADYVTSTYGGVEGLRRSFDRVMGLPPEGSDNAQRVEYLRGRIAQGSAPVADVLDVGCGTGVFPALMQRKGFRCFGLDRDPRLIAHLQERGVPGVCADFLGADFPGGFDMITFNKVLEHILDPLPYLKKATSLLRPGGAIYVELPDGVGAEAESKRSGRHREEFDIDHFHVFSEASLRHLVEKAGLVVEHMESVVEPSGKYTLRAFLRPEVRS